MHLYTFRYYTCAAAAVTAAAGAAGSLLRKIILYLMPDTHMYVCIMYFVVFHASKSGTQ